MTVNLISQNRLITPEQAEEALGRVLVFIIDVLACQDAVEAPGAAEEDMAPQEKQCEPSEEKLMAMSDTPPIEQEMDNSTGSGNPENPR